MEKPKGGRGKTGAFETTTIRIPKIIKPVVREMVDGCYETEGESVYTAASLDEAKQKVDEVLRSKKSAKKSMDLLIKKLYKSEKGES